MGELPFFSAIILLFRDFDYWPLNRGYHLVKVQLYLHRTLSGNLGRPVGYLQSWAE